MAGAPKAKVVPTTHIDDMQKSGVGFAGFAAGEMDRDHMTGYGRPP